MSNENIIKDTVLERMEKTEGRNIKGDSAGEMLEKKGQRLVMFYHLKKCDNGNIIYEIWLRNNEPKDLSYIKAIWQQEEGSNGNIIRFTLLRPTRETPDDEFTQHTLMQFKGKELALMMPVNKELVTQGFENKNTATLFVDAWNRAVDDAKFESLYSRMAKAYENAIKAHEIIQKRKKDPEWQIICEATKQLSTTQAEKIIARKLIQAYLQREKQNFKQE